MFSCQRADTVCRTTVLRRLENGQALEGPSLCALLGRQATFVEHRLIGIFDLSLLYTSVLIFKRSYRAFKVFDTITEPTMLSRCPKTFRYCCRLATAKTFQRTKMNTMPTRQQQNIRLLDQKIDYTIWPHAAQTRPSLADQFTIISCLSGETHSGSRCYVAKPTIGQIVCLGGGEDSRVV